MATNIETMWVSDTTQLNATVQTLVSQGGVVQSQADDQIQIFLKKKLNVAVLVVGLLLCLVPGLAYLIWYSTADQNQQITIKIGSPTQIKTDHQHWYNEPAIDGAVPGSVPPAVTAPPTDTPAVPPAAAAPLAPPAPASPLAPPADSPTPADPGALPPV